jgi:hypothetical protein
MKAGDKYTRTTEAIILYLQKKIDHVGAKVADTFRNMERIDLSSLEPQKPTAINNEGVVVPNLY